MTGANERTTVKVDAYTRVCLTAIAVTLTVLIVGLWATAPVSLTERATAAEAPGGIPDAGAQREAVIRAIMTTNSKLDRIASLLESGKLRVVVVEPKPEKPEKGVADVKKPAAQ